jgi:SAM-dependent methyltransferase
MHSYGPATYGDRIARVYDETHASLFSPEVTGPMVEVLAGLAADGTALELGIGTGRIALPLAARGVAVHGIDASEAMVARLREKDGGADIPVTIGDLAEFELDTEFSLIFVIFNTIFALLTQEDQVACFQRVADHLAEDGSFVVEAFVPDQTRFVRGHNVDVGAVDTDNVKIDVTSHDPVAQVATTQRIHFTDDGVEMYPVQLRYAWPSELDLMARLAGLTLRDRWGGWARQPFTAASTNHVSVYERA